MATTGPASRLAPCPRTPNCVSTEAPPGSSKRMDPIPYASSLDAARARLLQVLRDYPRTRIVSDPGLEPHYLKAECRSAVFRFVDDVEFVFDDGAKQIHFRSASRLGRKDFGVNRKRMEEIRAAFEGAGAVP
ncbi:MAG TPA: DUF1499 domain-containing protein [Thermoanaerobaculia bacterium]|nr:DUF1499 domain-containing protein [Thermoanaerobaculia bacterium]